MPCPICNDFKGSREMMELGKPTGLGSRNHILARPNWTEFRASAESCYICEILSRGILGCLQQYNIKESDIRVFILLFRYDDELGNALRTRKEFRFPLADGSRFDMELFAEGGGGPESAVPLDWESFPTSKRTSPRTDADAAMATIQSWMADCLGEGHEYCTAPTEATLPARVIDVGVDNSATIRLIEPPRGTISRYICLSHCWGMERPITATTSTMKERAAGIRMEDLPRTFQDAVALTRRLGVQYIWIDSLCILQDSLGDWEEQSAQMGDIYNKAYLTIAATHSRDGRGGLFHETPDFEVSGVAPGPGGGAYRIFFREWINHRLDFTEALEERLVLGHHSIIDHPLLTRAWVYQERMLSTRVLHFGRYEMFMECRSEIVCECGGIKFPGTFDADRLPVTKQILAKALDTEVTGEEWAEYGHYSIARLWRTMVSSYTALHITQHGDRLPAMGGLAKHMARKRKSAYCAGLWEDTLLDDLLWFASEISTPKRPRPVPRTVPTWFWASIEHDVLYRDGIDYWDPNVDLDCRRWPYHHFATVEECLVVPGGADEFGTILQDSLRIRGPVATGVLERGTGTQQTEEYHIVFPGGVSLTMREDYLLEEPGDHQVLAGAEVKCLRVCWTEEDLGLSFVSLVLRPLADSAGTYERIGCINIFIEGEASNPPDPAQVDPLEPVFRSAVGEQLL